MEESGCKGKKWQNSTGLSSCLMGFLMKPFFFNSKTGQKNIKPSQMTDIKQRDSALTVSSSCSSPHV